MEFKIFDKFSFSWDIMVHSTPPIMKKKYAEILLHYRWLFIQGDLFIGEWGIFGAEVFLCYRQFFIKSDLVIGRVECISALYGIVMTYYS